MQPQNDSSTFTVFAGTRRTFSGDLHGAVRTAKSLVDRDSDDAVMIFDDATGRVRDFDLQGTPVDVLARLPTVEPTPTEAPRTGPGRPKLGVVSREVSLLPRHWEWLESQPGGCSAALRRLVDDARKHGSAKETARAARDAAGKFMWCMGGDLPGFEEASRALYAGNLPGLEQHTVGWPDDVRAYLLALFARSLEAAVVDG
jgi:hypothetical protein